jgi:restriction endonuclease in pPIWI_RE module
MKHCSTFSTQDQVEEKEASMKKPLPENVFPYLVLGLAKYSESTKKYPYPAELSYALHHLALAMLSAFPRTITDLFELFSQPLEQWWPDEKLPNGIDPGFELLYEGELDEQGVEFLLEYKFPVEATLQDLQVILDNQLMINILSAARNASITDPAGANGEYVASRQYVITNPWTTSEALRRQSGRVGEASGV